MAKPKTPASSKTGASAITASIPLPKPKGAAPMSLPSAANQLPVPQVRNATANNTLPPLSSTSGTDVTITAAVAAGVKITVHWAIKGQEADPVFTAVATGTGNAGVEVPVPAWVVGFCIGQTLSIWYETATNRSLQLELTVEVIDPAHMPVPEFQDLVFFQGSWWLDMTKFPGNASIKLCAWSFIAAGQRLWVEAVGNEHLSPRRFSWVLEGHVVTEREAQEGFCFLLEIVREWLAENEDWSSVTVHAGVTFNGAEGSAAEDPSISHIPANAHEMQRATANLRVGEPEFKLRAPTIREAVLIEGQGYVINPANALNGLHIIVAYDGMRPGDQVCLTFAGTPGAGSPTLPCVEVLPGQTSVEFHVLPSVVSVNFDERITVAYRVQRESWIPSPTLEAHILNPTGLTGVRIEEAPDGKLCLNNFSGDANATIAPWDFIAAGQTCWLWIVGKFEDDRPFYQDVLVGEPVKPEWAIDGVDALLERQALETLADCETFDVHFAVNFRGLLDKPEALAFQTSPFRMEQADWVLEVPKVIEADDKQLTVWNGRDGVTVRVAYNRMSPHHEINLCWKENGACLPLPSKPGNSDPGYVEFKVPREAVIRGIGKTVPVSFSVSSQCKQITSPDLGLSISEPTRLPTPDVKEATLGVLKLDSFTGDAHVKVFDERFAKAYWFALVGQKAWIRAVGTLENGQPHVMDVRLAQNVTEEEAKNGLVGVLLRSQLQRLKEGAELTVTCGVTADGSSSEADAVWFTPLTVTVVMTSEIRHENFDDQPNQLIGAGKSISLSTMTIKFISGPEEMGIVRFSNIPGMLEGPALVFSYTVAEAASPQLIYLDLTFTCRRVQFAYTHHQFPTTFRFLTQQGSLLGSKSINESSRDGWVDFSVSDSSTIGRIEITTADFMFLDFFTFWL